MKSIKHMLVSVIRFVVMTGIILFTYIFVGPTVGTIIFIVGFILLLAIFIDALIGMIKGKTRCLKTSGRFNLFIVLTDCVVISLILLITWSGNILMQEEFGPLSAMEKMSFVHNALSSNEKEISSFTQDYPVLETNHITFRYHPDTEVSVERMVTALAAIEELEKEIYGHEIQKVKPLEVLVLRNADDYYQLNPTIKTEDAGLYDPNRKRTIMYYDGVNAMEEDFYVVETFIHEYSHYLLDLFIEQEDLKYHEVPVWINEGIAELMRNRIISSMRLPEERDSNISFLDLQTSFEWNQARETNDVYYQAYLAVEYIIGRHGNPSVLPEILLHQKETGDFAQSFDKTTGLKLTELHQTVSSVDQKLNLAWNTWSIDGDYQEAESLYEEVLEDIPYHNFAWQQSALMHEVNNNWDEAITARREHIQVNPTTDSLLNLSYMLVLTDSKEAATMALEALEASENGPYDQIFFYEQWVEDVSHYHQLMAENKTIEAYESIMKSEHLSYQPTILEELINMRNAVGY